MSPEALLHQLPPQSPVRISPDQVQLQSHGRKYLQDIEDQFHLLSLRIQLIEKMLFTFPGESLAKRRPSTGHNGRVVTCK